MGLVGGRAMRGIYLAAIMTAGAAVLLASAASVIRQPPEAPWGALVALTMVVAWSAIRMPGFVISASPGDAFVVASAVLYGPAAGALTAACDGLVGSLRVGPGKRTAARAFFNTSASALSVWLATRLFAALAGGNGAAPLSEGLARMAGPLIALAVAYYLLNSTLILGAIVAGRGLSFATTWREHLLPLATTHVSGSLAGGAIAVILAGAEPLHAALFALPLAIVVVVGSRRALVRIRQRSARFAELRIYAAALRSTADAVVVTDPEGRVAFLNRAAEDLTGWTLEAARGRLTADVLRFTDDPAAAGWTAAQALTPDPDREAVLVRRDGSTCPVEQSKADIQDEDLTVCGVVHTLRDVSWRQALDEQRAELLRREHRARVAAEDASRLKDDFLATLSHELRTPTSAVLGWASILKDGHLDDERTKAALAALERSARAQAAVLNDLLDTSRIVQGALRLEIRRTDIDTVIHDALDTVRPAAEARNVTLRVQIQPDLPVIDADPARLRQVLWNLLANAVKFTPPGGAADIRARSGPDGLEIVVADTGIGIAPEFLPFVFDRFRQEDSSAGRAHGGLGLGLAIVRDLVEAHGGRVTASSEGRGRGAVFVVYLPMVHRRRASDPPS